MSASEFNSWRAYLTVEPHGTPALEILHAQNTQCSLAAAGAKSRLQDFMPFTNNIMRLAGVKRGAFNPQAAYDKFKTTVGKVYSVKK